MKRFVYTIRMPLIGEVVNCIAAQIAGPSYGFLAFPLITAALAIWAGFLISRQPWGSLAHAGWGGPLVLLVGILATGAYFAISGPFGADELKNIPERAQHAWVLEYPRLTVLGGVLMGSLLIMPLAALLSFLGGLLAKHSKPAGA